MPSVWAVCARRFHLVRSGGAGGTRSATFLRWPPFLRAVRAVRLCCGLAYSARCAQMARRHLRLVAKLSGQAGKTASGAIVGLRIAFRARIAKFRLHAACTVSTWFAHLTSRTFDLAVRPGTTSGATCAARVVGEFPDIAIGTIRGPRVFAEFASGTIVAQRSSCRVLKLAG